MDILRAETWQYRTRSSGRPPPATETSVSSIGRDYGLWKVRSLYKLILNYRKVGFFLGGTNFSLEQNEGTFWLKVFYVPNFS